MITTVDGYRVDELFDWRRTGLIVYFLEFSLNTKLCALSPDGLLEDSFGSNVCLFLTTEALLLFTLVRSLAATRIILISLLPGIIASPKLDFVLLSLCGLVSREVNSERVFNGFVRVNGSRFGSRSVAFKAFLVGESIFNWAFAKPGDLRPEITGINR